MVELTHRATLLGAPVDAVLTVDDLDILQTSEGMVLLATSRATGMVTSYELSGSSANFWASSYTPAVLGALGGGSLERLDIGGTTLVFPSVASGTAVTTYRLADSGALVNSGVTLRGGNLDGSLTALTSVTLGGQPFVFTGHQGDPGVGRYRLADGGVLVNTRDPSIAMPDRARDISALVVVDTGGAAFLVTASARDHHLSTYQLDTAGRLAYRGRVGPDQGLGLAGPQAVSHVAIDGVDYLLVAASLSSSVTVLRMGSDGSLEPIDHVVDDQNSRFQGVSAIETLSVDGRVFVIVGGADGGITLFQLLPHGQLLMLDVQEDREGMSLGQVAALAATVENDQLQIFVGSGNEAGVSHFTVDLPSVGQELTATTGGALYGGGAGDILFDGSGDEQLYGAAGDDILIGGTGSDRFDGGAGQDIFMLTGDGLTDHILRFEAGQDQIDLTGWSGLYGVSELRFDSTSSGGRISFGGESVVLTSSDGTSLSAAQLRDAVMPNFIHTAVRGGEQDALIEGTLQNDDLVGTFRDDILRGLAGADTLRGGAGSDTVSYEDSRGSLRADLLFSHINTNVAAGDVYSSIENIIGSQGFDNLRGTFGDNYVFGGRNVDYIFGRRGDDLLEGGIGDDVLFGGVGRDTLVGGPHRDRAQYSESLTPILADLALPRLNTGEAAGDTYSGIEDLAGGRFADQLFGDREANRLFGREGADQLFGRQGDDYLNGGAHADRLDGGDGDDVLRGGTHADTFVFSRGNDHIEDFNLGHGDLVELDRALSGLGSRGAAEIIADFGTIEGGHVVLTFGDDSLTFDSLSSFAGLEGAMVLM